MTTDTGADNALLQMVSQRLSELSDEVRSLRTHVDDKVDQITKTVDKKIEQIAITYVSKDLFGELQRRVADLESDRKKYIGIVVTSVIVAVLAIILKNGDLKL